MLAKARTAAAEMGAANVEFVEGDAERLPFPDESSELHRVLAPGGRLQIADVTIQNPVSEEGGRNIKRAAVRRPRHDRQAYEPGG